MKPQFKTTPFKHQLRALKLSQDEKAYALLMEQGTGKSKVVIDTAAHLWRKGQIDAVLIVAPKGVAPEWVNSQLPKHMPMDVGYVAALWKAKSSQTRKGAERVKEVLEMGSAVLRIFVMNTEAFGATEDAVDFAITALDSAQSTLVVIDESHRIKTPSAHTTKRIVNLRNRAAYRRILTGTIGDKPFDLFSQFAFLDPEILGVRSFTAFKAEYAEMLPMTSGLMRHIAMRTKHPPQIVATNADGTPKYKNLDRLQKLIAPHSYRVLKRDCLDLPEKLYSRYYTDLSDKQWRLYDQIKKEQRIEWEEGRVTTFNKLTALLRLQQVVCGYLPDVEGMIQLFDSWTENPRVRSLLDLIADRPENESAIIWCRFIEDIRQVSAALGATYGDANVVQFYGETKDKARLEAVERFETKQARFMISQQRAGGVGQTWVAATLSVHYSNTFSLIDRLQAEDRPHRIGQKHPVQYIDLEAEGTVDSAIINALISKKNVADVINADEEMAWLK